MVLWWPRARLARWPRKRLEHASRKFQGNTGVCAANILLSREREKKRGVVRGGEADAGVGQGQGHHPPIMVQQAIGGGGTGTPASTSATIVNTKAHGAAHARAGERFALFVALGRKGSSSSTAAMIWQRCDPRKGSSQDPLRQSRRLQGFSTTRGRPSNTHAPLFFKN